MTLQTEASYLSLASRVMAFSRETGITFLLQVAVLAAAAASVEAAGWVESPPLVLVVFLAALTAALLVNLREHRRVHHLWAVLVGLFFAYLGGVYLTEADQWYSKFGALHSRVGEWWSAIMGEDATTDTLPLTVALVAITWLAAYFTSWGLFRYRNVWATLLPMGAGTIINLTYLPERFSVYLFAFLFFGLLLLVQVTSLKQRSQLQTQGIPHPPSFHRMSIANGLWISVIILAITIVIPIGDSPATPLKWVFKPMNKSVENLRGELHRIFAAVPGYDLASLRFFGDVLPLMRPVPTGNDPIFFSDSQLPRYWRAIAYDQYTSKAWKVEDTEPRPLASSETVDQAVARVEEELDVLEDTFYSIYSTAYGVRMFVDSPYLLVAEYPVLVNPRAERVLPISKAFRLDLAEPEQNGDLPLDLQRLASALAASEGNGGSLDWSNMPADLQVNKVIKELSPSGRKTSIEVEAEKDLKEAVSSQGTTVEIEVTRLPLGRSPVSLRSLEPLGPDGEYAVVAEPILASELALRSSPDEYPPGITDRYLQIPSTLPSRVSVLASNITFDGSNAYDKAVAVETYLRALEYTVASQQIPHDSDTVDYFLYESREGYSDYFASAMAMMLRTLGIPTRLVLGFGPGEQDPDDQGFLVRDKDSHSWPEVYFTNIGWVPFEPTPIYETRSRGLPSSSIGPVGLPVEQGALEELDTLDGLLDGEEEELRDDFGGPLPGGEGIRSLPLRYFGTPLGVGGALFVLFLLMGAALMRIFWVRQYGGLQSPRAAYERMHRLATFLGAPSAPSQTAFEFSSNLSRLIPEASADVDLVSNTFVRQRYGGVTPSAMEEMRLIWAWRRIKRALLAHLTQTNEATTSPG